MSAGLFVAAVFNLVDPETFAYRTLPGTLFMFMVGMSLARRDVVTPWFPQVVWLGAVVLLVLVAGHDGIARPAIGTDVLLGLVVGVPAVAVLRRLPQRGFDTVAGNLSYGVFLNHLVCMNLLEQMVGLPVDSVAGLAVLVAVSMSGSAVTFLVIERPVLALRRRLRAAPVLPIGGGASQPAESIVALAAPVRR